MTIRDQHHVPVMVLRVASLGDVVRIKRRAPSEDDLRAVEARSYLVVRDASANNLSRPELTAEQIRDRTELTDDVGGAEVDEAVAIFTAAARFHIVRFRVEETREGDRRSTTCVQVEYNPYEDEVDLTVLEKRPGDAEWSWARDATPVLKRSTLEHVVDTIRRVCDARAIAARDLREGALG